MKNVGLFSTLFIEDVRGRMALDDSARGRMATLTQTWSARNDQDTDSLWNTFVKQALGYLKYVLPSSPSSTGVYPLYEDYNYATPITVLYLCPTGANLDDVDIGRFWPGRLVAELRKHKLNWGILSDGARWRLYSLKTAKPYEDFVELDLADALAKSDEAEYALFEKFVHRDSFVAKVEEKDDSERSRRAWKEAKELGVYRCELDECRTQSDDILEDRIKKPLLAQVDEVLQYLCNGFIADTPRKGEEYTEEERREIFESAVKLLYRCLFLFYAEARSLLPSEPEKRETYARLSIMHICTEARKFRWGQRKDNEGFDLWTHLKGLANAVNDGDPEYGIMGYNGGLFDDEEERFLGRHKLRNDFLARALYLLSYVEPFSNEQEDEYPIPYADLEVRHLGELYENILEFNVTLADADRIRRRTKKGVQIVLASETKLDPKTDSRIRKGDVYFGETALERKQTGSYYTPETLVQFLNQKTIVNPLRERFDKEFRPRFAVFCKEAASGRDLPARRGAAQSAVALIERFVDDVVLKFRACDPAMGSGHFLVNGANQITDLIVELLAEVPYVQGLKSRVTCSPNHWRRLVTRHCLYGVDLNRLAVHLAKLSLWLNCFARDHKLTFLDHHVKSGNSLIGIRVLSQLRNLPERANARKKAVQGLLFPSDLKKACIRVLAEIEKIGRVGEDDTDRMKALHEQATGETRAIEPLADLYTAYLMEHTIDDEDYCEIFSDLAHGRRLTAILSKEIQENVAALASRHHFFHWALEFPEVFGGDDFGFDATVGNPPWDILKPKSQEFFLAYDPGFRGYDKQEAVKVSKRLLEEHESIRLKWEEYSVSFDEQSLYVRQPDAYEAVGNGDVNTFKIFIEQFFALASKGGRMGIIVPSGLHTDQGCQPLRKLLFDQSKIDIIYGFENRRAVFNIHRSFKFDLFCAQKGGKTDAFKCAFMEHDPEILLAIDAEALNMTVEHVQKFSGSALSVPEFSNGKTLRIGLQLLGKSQLLGEELGIRVEDEVHKTNESHLFCAKNDSAWPVYQGGQVWLFDHEFSSIDLWIPGAKALAYAKEEIISASRNRKHLLCRPDDDFVPENHWSSEPRLVFREVAASTNERTFIFAMIPANTLHTYSLRSIERWYLYGKDPKVIVCKEEWSYLDLLVLQAVMNSYIVDFYARTQCTNHLSTIYMFMPLAREVTESRFAIPLASRALRLSCTSIKLSDLWGKSFQMNWNKTDLWYPSGIHAYGPKHERDIREQLAEEVSALTPKWTATCGVHDRLPDRRDTGDRAQLRAEIDAYVAHLYGLSRDDFEYILGTFPVLEKKEIKAFGEFQSKRKCLEEYDRLVEVLRP